MKKICLFLTLCISLGLYSQSTSESIALIPQPVTFQKQAGTFVLANQVTIYVGKNLELKRLGKSLADRITGVTGIKVTLNENEIATTSTSSNGISLVLSADKSISKEGYQLTVTTTHVTLRASEPSGIFYGIQTLLQLLPKEIEATHRQQKLIQQLSDGKYQL